MIEAEYKAKLTAPDRVRAALRERAIPNVVSYQDTYYDTPSGDLDRTGRELRLRTVEDSSGTQRHVLTFKDPAVDDATGSKFEFTASGRRMRATIANVPEIDGTVLELETQTEGADFSDAFTDLRQY